MRKLWTIEKALPGRYHNSAWVWRRVGVVRAFKETSALLKAREIVGADYPVRVSENTTRPIFP